MDENILTTDADDSELMGKFDGLVKKYRNQGRPLNAVKKTAKAFPGKLAGEGSPVHATSDAIPVLTEVVTLRPSLIQPQPKRMTPVQKLLDAALEETGITMNPHDRKVLANALEFRLTGRIIR